MVLGLFLPVTSFVIDGTGPSCEPFAGKPHTPVRSARQPLLAPEQPFLVEVRENYGRFEPSQFGHLENSDRFSGHL